jgi:hypothetical protein
MRKTAYYSLFFGIFLVICCIGKASDRWLHRYSYIQELTSPSLSSFSGSEDYFLVVLVNARHPDYSSPFAYIWDLTWHYICENQPDTGHAWIVLVGKQKGKRWIFEGGHSVNCTVVMPRYAKKLISLVCDEAENPARSLFKSTSEGLFEYGSGNNNPTFAAAFPLTQNQFERIISSIKDYQFAQWGLKGPNCVVFVQNCLTSIGIECPLLDTVEVPQTVGFAGMQVQLWSDPSYALLDVKTPDLLEKRLYDLVKTEKATSAVSWYHEFKQQIRAGKLSTNELPFYPKRLVTEQVGDSMTIRCAEVGTSSY